MTFLGVLLGLGLFSAVILVCAAFLRSVEDL